MSTMFFLPSQHHDNSWLLAEGIESTFIRKLADQSDWRALNLWLEQNKTWRFGWISYNAGHTMPNINLEKDQRSSFPQIFFFVPQNLALLKDGEKSMLKGTWKDEYNVWFDKNYTEENISLKPETSHEDYLRAVENIMSHIQYGDIYEMNYCQIFSAQEKIRNPISIWKKLYTLTEAPHAVYAQHEHWHVLSASPERYIAKKGDRVISQPIKGTIKRGENEKQDLAQKNKLLSSQKERSENVMIVDLVRNDLSRIAKRGSVQVDELFGVHTFKTVHHLISTISCQVDDHISFTQILEDTFPMGSMTGAPKISAMKIAQQYEQSGRDLYSGTIGYLTPDGDFDFNVVIRSILYDESLPRISVGVGGAITSGCTPDQEYEECLLKAKALLKALSMTS